MRVYTALVNYACSDIGKEKVNQALAEPCFSNSTLEVSLFQGLGVCYQKAKRIIERVGMPERLEDLVCLLLEQMSFCLANVAENTCGEASKTLVTSMFDAAEAVAIENV